MPQKRHEVPTHLNVEDRAFYGLSARQVMLLTVGVSGAYGLWNQWADLAIPVRLGVAVVCMLFALALAFIRPGGRGFEEWAFTAIRYLALPKAMVWRPRAPDPCAWRPTTAQWEDLTPTVTWVGGER